MGDGNFEAQSVMHKPLYHQVGQIVLARIRNGDWQPGQSLPNEHLLASEFGVSIGTIRRAIEGLERIGAVSRQQGRGTFVRCTSADLASSTRWPLRIRDRRGAMLTCDTLSIDRRRSAPADRGELKLVRSCDVIECTSLIRLESEPVAVERSIIPSTLLAGCEVQFGSADEIRALLADRGMSAKWVEDRIEIVGATAQVAAAMSITSGKPLLRCCRSSSAADGTIIESQTLHLGSSELEYACRAK